MIPRRAITALALTGGALALAACGKQAELVRPHPIFGREASQPNVGVRTRQGAEARARADGGAVADPIAPQSVDEVRAPGPPSARPALPVAPAQSERVDAGAQ